MCFLLFPQTRVAEFRFDLRARLAIARARARTRFFVQKPRVPFFLAAC